jgi:hypothetical protein
MSIAREHSEIETFDSRTLSSAFSRSYLFVAYTRRECRDGFRLCAPGREENQ